MCGGECSDVRAACSPLRGGGGAEWCVCPRCRPLAARASPVRRAGAVFECVHVATRAVVAVKLLLAIANEPGAEVESPALRDR